MTENEALKMVKGLQIAEEGDMVKTFELKRVLEKALEDIQAYRAIGTVEECRDAVKNRDKAIEEFAEKVKNSPHAHLWCCKDLSLEFCSMDDCEVCMDKFKKQIDEIAEQMKQTHECD